MASQCKNQKIIILYRFSMWIINRRCRGIGIAALVSCLFSLVLVGVCAELFGLKECSTLVDLKLSIDNFDKFANNINIPLGLCLQGSYQEAPLHVRSEFQVKLVALNGLKCAVDHSSASLHVRLLNNHSIINAEIKTIAEEYWKVSYVIPSMEAYRLQIRLGWLRGNLLGSVLPLKHQPATRFLNFSKHVDQIVFDGPLKAIQSSSSSSLSSVQSNPKQLCRFANSAGRWLRASTCSSLDCPSGSLDNVSWLDDKFGFNTDMIWVPYECYYRIYSKDDVLSCFSKKKINSVAFCGDSLLREHFQNFIMLLNPEMVYEQNLMKFKNSKSLELKFDRHNLTLHYFPIPDDKSSHNIAIDAYFWSFVMNRVLNSEDVEARLVRHSHEVLMNSYHAVKRIALRQTEAQRANTRFFLHPVIQREDPRVNREELRLQAETLSARSEAGITNGRQGLAVKETRRVFKDLGSGLLDTIVDAQLPTAARWESSWDGLHYSLLISDLHMLASTNSTCKAGYYRGSSTVCGKIETFPGVNKCVDELDRDTNTLKRIMYWCRDIGSVFQHFEGGVSRMLTMIWINSLCNY